MKIDLHAHCSERSPCGCSGEEEMIERAIGFGLDGLFFTDHGRNTPEERLLELNAKYEPFKIFRGIEVSAGAEHIVVLGISVPGLEDSDSWTYPALRRFVSANEGFMILAHPYRYEPVADEVLEDPPDAVELRSVNINPENEPMIVSAAERMECGVVCASDAHADEDVGMYHVILEKAASDEREVISSLMAGEYSCGADDSRVNKMLEQKWNGEPAKGR